MRKIQGNIKYKDLNSKEIEQVSMILMNDMLFNITVDKDSDESLILSMEDLITSNVELKGRIGLEELQALIKQLSVMYKQLKFCREVK